MVDFSKLDISNIISDKEVTHTPFIQKDFITMELLKGIMPAIPVVVAGKLAPILNELLPKYQLNTAEVFPDFIAQCAEESGSFTSFTENLYYSAERLHAVWPSRFPTIDSAKPYEHNGQKLANKIYANRMGNGDEASWDGWNYRGCGVIMLTGKDMITAFAKYIGKDVKTVINLLRYDLLTAVESAMWYFVVLKHLLGAAEIDDIVSITKAINGGTTNLAARKEFFERAVKLMIPITNNES